MYTHYDTKDWGKAVESTEAAITPQSGTRPYPTHRPLCWNFSPDTIRFTGKSGISEDCTPEELSALMSAHRGTQFTYVEQLLIPQQLKDVRDYGALLRYSKDKKQIIIGTFAYLMDAIDFSAFEIFYIDETMGYGLKTLKAFKKGDLLLPYFGSFINTKNRPRDEELKDHYSMKAAEDDFAITAEKLGGMASMVNWMPSAEFTAEMSEPILNANVIIESHPLEEGKKLVLPFFKAITDIPENTQLGCDWGHEFFLSRDFTPLVFSPNGQIAPEATQSAFRKAHQQRIDNPRVLKSADRPGFDVNARAASLKAEADAMLEKLPPEIRQTSDIEGLFRLGDMEFFDYNSIMIGFTYSCERPGFYIVSMLAYAASKLHYSMFEYLLSESGMELNMILEIFSQFPEFVEQLKKKQKLTIETCFPDIKFSDNEVKIKDPKFQEKFDEISINNNREYDRDKGPLLWKCIKKMSSNPVDQVVYPYNPAMMFRRRQGWFFNTEESNVGLKESDGVETVAGSQTRRPHK